MCMCTLSVPAGKQVSKLCSALVRRLGVTVHVCGDSTGEHYVLVVQKGSHACLTSPWML